MADVEREEREEREEPTVNHLRRLKDALDQGRLAPARRLLGALHPAEIAHLLESLPPNEREITWELVDPELDGEVLLHVNDEVRAGLLRHMDLDELASAIEGMDLDDLADFMQDLPETISQELLTSMSQQDRTRLETVLSFPEDSAGGLMNTDAISVRAEVSLDVVLRYLRLRGEIPDQTDSLFVVDRNSHYLGLLSLSQLLIHSPDKTVGEIMNREVEGILATMPAEEVAKIFEQRDFISAPVVDEDNRLLGRITIDDVVDVIRDQGEHALMSMSGLDEEEDMFAPVVTSARRRAVWLGINLVTAFMAAWVIGLFEATLQEVVALAVLMPIVASMGGIAGSQSLTLMIRGLALGQVEGGNARWLLGKELAVGFLNGLLWAVVVAVVAVVWFKSLAIGGIIAIAILINLLAAALAGVLVPLAMRRFGIDPALAGSVVLTTVTDIVGFFAFLGLATVLLL